MTPTPQSRDRKWNAQSKGRGSCRKKNQRINQRIVPSTTSGRAIGVVHSPIQSEMPSRSGIITSPKRLLLLASSSFLLALGVAYSFCSSVAAFGSLKGATQRPTGSLANFVALYRRSSEGILWNEHKHLRQSRRRLSIHKRLPSLVVHSGSADTRDGSSRSVLRVGSSVESTMPNAVVTPPASSQPLHRNGDDQGLCLVPQNLLQAADTIIWAERAIHNGGQQPLQAPELQDASTLSNEQDVSRPPATRRLFFAGTIISAGLALGVTGENDNNSFAQAAIVSPVAAAQPRLFSKASGNVLPWEVTPVNKRTGVTVFDAEQAGYNVGFVTYLSRFLLCFDDACQRWWYNRASDIPRAANAEQVQQARLRQFAAFSASVEVGLQDFRGPKGPSTLLQSLLRRYCPSRDAISAERASNGLPPLSEAAEAKQDREIKEARRQIALLFSLMGKNQPVNELSRLLAAIDNGTIAEVEIIDPGAGYAPGYGPPAVHFPPPQAGEGYETAAGRAVLRPNGRILRIDVVNRGYGYNKPPEVTVSPPAALRFGTYNTATTVNATNTPMPEMAVAKAVLFRSGPNKGRIERIIVTNPGAGYRVNEIIRVRFSPPDYTPQNGGIMATATAVLEYQVDSINIVNNGTGYAAELPITVEVDPPPLTARVNMNDPLMVRIISPSDSLSASSASSKSIMSSSSNPLLPNAEALKRLMAEVNDPSSRLSMEASRGGGGGCIGRACYDRPVQAVAYPRPERAAVGDSYISPIFKQYRTDDENTKARKIEDAIVKRSANSYVVRASSSGADLPEILTFGTGPSSSTQLLSLLPAGIGLEYSQSEARYVMAVDPNYQPDESIRPKWLREGTQRIDPDFGPRGRSPIERDMELGIAAYLRFVASGAICCSGVHLALTPIDVVKTKVQTDPQRYPGIVKSFKRILKEEGGRAFFNGWAPTFVGFFLWGGLSYAMTEYLRRTATGLAGSQASANEVPIILFASGAAAFLGSFVLSPFEAVRIRSVYRPDYAPNIIAVSQRMVAEEGVKTLFAAVPAFLAKEIPFAMAKFTVFDLSTAALYQAFPAAREDLQLSLLISVAGGTLGGIAAAVVSNPADVTISQMKKSKSDLNPWEAAQMVVQKGGYTAMFTGLPLRMIFYSLLVSLQFLVYDSVRFALGIGSDDLKLYLDVLGGALREGGGPVS